MLSLLLLLATAQSAQQVRERLASGLESGFPDLDPARRAALADEWSPWVLRAREFGHDPERVLTGVEGRLAQDRVISSDIAAAFRLISGSAREHLPAGTTVPSFPPTFAARERDAHLESIGSYLGEVVPRPAADDAQKKQIEAQVRALAEEVRAAARSRIHGPHRDGIIDRCVAGGIANLLGPELGDPVEGGLTRPLSREEMAGLVARVRERAAKMEPVDASSDQDAKIAAGGPTSLSGRSKALEAAMDLCMGLYAYADVNYPRYLGALQAKEDALAEAGNWFRTEWAPVERQLEAIGAKRFKVPFPPVPPSARHRLEGPDPVSAAKVGPADSRSPESATPPVRNRTLVLLAILALCAGIAGLALRKTRRPSPE